MSDLTRTQLIVLCVADRYWRNRDDLAGRARAQHDWDGSLEGLGQTVGSLVRRGLLERTKIDGRVCWRLTNRGAAVPTGSLVANRPGGLG